MSKRNSDLPIWNFFVRSIDGSKTATCNYCRRELSFRTSVTNLKSHLKQKHISLYNNLMSLSFGKTLESTASERDHDAQAGIFNRECATTSQSTSVSEDEHECTQPPIRKKRKLNSTKSDSKEEAYKFMKKATEELTQKDELTIYGQLIARKILNLNKLNRLLAQQRINNILFDLEIQQITGAAATQKVTEMQNVTELPTVIEIQNFTAK